MVQDRTILTMADNSKSYMIYRTAPLSTILRDPYPRFHGHATEYLRNGTRYRHRPSFNGILMGTYTRRAEVVILNDLEWPWVI